MKTRLDQIWTTGIPAPDDSSPSTNGDGIPWNRSDPGVSQLISLRAGTNRIGNALLWPLAAMIIFHCVFFLAVNGSPTDDFGTVYNALRRFLDGSAVYVENYSFVDPHYLYNPGATVVLSPLALSSHFAASRFGFILLNAAAIIAALAILTRMFCYRLSSFVYPLSLCIAFSTEAVRNTLIFANINGVMLLIFAGFLWALLRNRSLLAGVLIGFAILIKPLFAPLLLLPLVRAQWSTIAGGIVIPVVANLAASFVVADFSSYWSTTAPYLRLARDYANSSLPGAAAYFGLPPAEETALFVVFALVVAVGVIFVLRVRVQDPPLFLALCSGLLLSGVFFLSALGQMYYSMLLFPLAFAFVREVSLGANPLAWLGLVFSLFPGDWASERFYSFGSYIGTFGATVGWCLLIVVISTTAVAWYFSKPRTHASLLSDA